MRVKRVELNNWRYVVPSFFTLAAMLAGFLSILLAVEGMRTGCLEFPCYRWSAQLILLAMILDGFDGNIARWLKAESDFGAELDTYVDMTAFGLAPAVLIYAVTLQPHYHPLWRVVLPSAVALSGVVRLARFKVKDPFRGQAGYCGLPITGNASWVALFVFISQVPATGAGEGEDPYSLSSGAFATLFLFGVIVFTVLQVSNVRYPKPTKNMAVFVFCVLLVILMLALQANAAIPVAVVMLMIGLGYVIFGPLFCRHKARKKAARERSDSPTT